MAEVLKLVQEPKLKTHVMHAANLSFNQLQYYFDTMLSAGLIQNTGDNKWTATEKGIRYFHLIEEAEKLCKTPLSINPDPQK